MKKFIIALFVPLLMLTACNPNSAPADVKAEASSPQSEASPKPPSVETPSAESKAEIFYDILTGLPADKETLSKRPVAVMVNNIKPALPQRGISQAGIIYELPVEGGVTRLMAVFSDYERLPEVGSVRSARHDFVEIANSLNALYVHFGWSESAKEAIARLGVDNINGIEMTNTAFYMDAERAKVKSSEHCWFTTAELVEKGIDNRGYSMAAENQIPIFKFSDGKKVLSDTASAVTAEIAEVTVTSGNPSTFTYDAESGKYRKTQSGGAHIDETTGNPIELDNVFLMYTDIKNMSDNYHKEIALESGEGYYLSKGEAVKASFKKENADSPIKAFGESGAELIVNPGQSYFCIMDRSNMAKLKLSAAE